LLSRYFSGELYFRPLDSLGKLNSSQHWTMTLAKLLIEKGIITQQEFLAKISEERATYQAMFKPSKRT
jgi:hypothetical protein